MRMHNFKLGLCLACILGFIGPGRLASEVIYVPFEKLVAEPEKYDGQMVRTVAYFKEGETAFWPDPRAWKQVDYDRDPNNKYTYATLPGVWLGGINSQAIAEGKIAYANESWVLVQGRFKQDDYFFRGYLDDVTLMELWMTNPDRLPNQQASKTTLRRLQTDARIQVQSALFVATPGKPMRFLLYPKAKAVVQD